jgi:gliding motility-associated lipoprotein GldD
MMPRKKTYFQFTILSGFLSLMMISCNSHFTPKPKGYFRIDLPQHAYQQFDEPGFPYSFEFPVYAKISKEADTTGENPYWINIDFKDFNGRIYLSYKSINGRSVYKVKTEKGYRDSIVVNNFENLREEAYKMTYKHTIKSSGIIDSFFNGAAGSGVYFYVAGEAATSKQFYVSDSSRHFLRGALYFDASPNEDSLSLVSHFLESDIRHMLKTLKWK